MRHRYIRWRFFIFHFALFTAAARAAGDPAAFDAAKALFDAKKLAEAQQAFTKLAAADPKDAEVNFYLGELALRRDELEKAATFFEKASAAAPTVGRYQRRLGDAYGTQAQKASIFSQLGLAKKCLAAYQRAAALDPNDIDTHLSLFEYYRQAPSMVGGGIDKATAEATAVQKLDPIRGHSAFITLYTAEKKYADAYPHAAEIKKLDATRGRQALAQIYVAEKKFDLAFAEFEEALKTTPDDYGALYQFGRLAAITGQSTDRGIASLRRCLELPPPPPNTPGHAAAHWRLGNLLEKNSDLAGARAAYEAALKLDPNFTAAADALKKLPRAN